MAGPSRGSARFADPPAGTDSYAPLLNWLADHPGYRGGRAPVPSNLQDARLAGARLDHPLGPLPERLACERLRATDAWLIAFREERFGAPPVAAGACVAGLTPRYESADVRVYRVGR